MEEKAYGILQIIQELPNFTTVMENNFMKSKITGMKNKPMRGILNANERRISKAINQDRSTYFQRVLFIALYHLFH